MAKEGVVAYLWDIAPGVHRTCSRSRISQAITPTYGAAHASPGPIRTWSVVCVSRGTGSQVVRCTLQQPRRSSLLPAVRVRFSTTAASAIPVTPDQPQPAQPARHAPHPVFLERHHLEHVGARMRVRLDRRLGSNVGEPESPLLSRGGETSTAAVRCSRTLHLVCIS